MRNSNKFLVGAIALLIAFVQFDAQAQNLSGVEIMTTVGIDDPNTPCPKTFGSYTGPRLFRDGVAAGCPGKACPGNFGNNTFAYDYFRFKNIVSTPVCITINVNTGACGADVHSWAQYSIFTPPGDLCPDNPGWLGDIGSSTSQPYSVEVDGCAAFTVAFGNNFGLNNCNYSFNIAPDPLLDLRCSDEPMCIQKVTIGGTPVPTMTQWGLFLFGLVVLTLGVVTIYNMSTNRVSERS